MFSTTLQPGDRVLVTGASSGIGRAVALAVAEAGAVPFLVARRADRLAEVADSCRAAGAPQAIVEPLDLSDPVAAEQLAVRLWDDHDGLDVLVHNAGMPMRRHATRLTGEQVATVMAVNYLAPVHMTLALLPRMLARGSGAIVAVGSVGGRWGISREAAYSGSKFALTGFFESLAVDLSGSPLRVRLVQPGPIDTEIWERPGNEDGAYAGERFPPEDVAAAVLAALAPDAPLESFVPAAMAGVLALKHADPEAFRAALADSDAAGGGIEG